MSTTTDMPAFTPDEKLELLFAPDLIPADVKAALGDDLHVRTHLCPPGLSDSSYCG